jgi:hypothetical protein
MLSELASAQCDPAHRSPEQRGLRPWALQVIWIVRLSYGLHFDELAKMQMNVISHLYHGITINF